MENKYELIEDPILDLLIRVTLRVSCTFVVLLVFIPLEGMAQRTRTNYQPKAYSAKSCSECANHSIQQVIDSIGSYFRMFKLTQSTLGWKALWSGISPLMAYNLLQTILRVYFLDKFWKMNPNLSGINKVVQELFYLPNIAEAAVIVLVLLPFQVLTYRYVGARCTQIY